VRSSDGVDFTFPNGINWSTATPTQIAEAVLTAVKANPNDASRIAASSVHEITASGRFADPGVDGKTASDPEPTFWSFRWLFPRKQVGSR